MINPLDMLLDPVSLGIMGMYALLMLWEAFFPARVLPAIRFWRLKGIFFFFLFFFMSGYIPYFCAAWLPAYPLLNLSNLHPVLGAIAGILLYEFGVFIWHRTMHRSNILWRVFHQMHHSAERMDTFGAFYFSPLDMLGWIALSTVCFACLTGLPAASITVILLVVNFFTIFTHANISTPRWLGYIIQRPESHALHHGKGIHAYNYSDLPVYDIIFGSFRNPEKHPQESGFYNGASSRVSEMLRFKSVDRPPLKVNS